MTTENPKKEEEGEEEDPPTTPTSAKKKKVKKPHDDDEEEEESHHSSPGHKKKKKTTATTTKKKDSTASSAGEVEKEKEELSEGVEGTTTETVTDSPHGSKKKKKTTTTTATTSKKKDSTMSSDKQEETTENPSGEVEGLGISDISEDESKKKSTTKKKKKKKPTNTTTTTTSTTGTKKKKKKKTRVKDLESGISFTIHDAPLTAKNISRTFNMDDLEEDDDAAAEDELQHTEHEGVGRGGRSAETWLQPAALAPKYRLVTEEDSLKWSMMALRFAVLATACGQTVLQPNFPFLVLEGETPDSFPNTDPFDFSAATYFLPMTTLFGTAITSAIAGSLSDKLGRRPIVMICMGMSTITLVIQYLARHTFWGFSAASFANGLFCSVLPVAMAYASDVHPSRVKKDEEIGTLVAANMLGMSGGGVMAILMDNQNLFAPSLVAAGIDFLSFIVCYKYLIEPDKDTVYHPDELDETVRTFGAASGGPGSTVNDDDDDEKSLLQAGDVPDHIDWKLFTNVMVGALLDNIGSSGLFPLTLAPLAFNKFYLDFELADEDPIMSVTGYKWLSVCVALMVIPGAALTEPVFSRIGAAGGCVAGNAITAVGILACTLIAEIDPPTSATFAGFIVFLYCVFPLTVISQLSTGPMLDMLSPPDRRGFAQGMNMTIMSFAFAVSPWMLGVMSDNVGIVETLYFCVGVSVLAAIVNGPLMFAKILQRQPPIDFQRAMGLEDQELVDKAVRGEWVPAKFVDDLNFARFRKGLPMLRIPIRDYAEDKENLKLLRKHAREDFKYHRVIMHEIISELEDPQLRHQNMEIFNRIAPSEEIRNKDADAIGKWFGDYMKDTGYFLDGGWGPVYQQMFMKAFPPINQDGEINESNVEKHMVKMLANMNRFLRKEGTSQAVKGFRKSVVV